MLEDAKASQDSEVTLRELAAMLWSRRWFIALITVLGTVAAVAASYLVDRQYQATVVVSAVANPGSSGGMGGAGALASQFGGIASLAGISVGGDNKKAESLAVLQSEALTEDFITKNDLLPIIYKKLWDPSAKKWKVTDPKKVPSLWKANQYFKTNIRKVVPDPKSGLVTVTVTWTDPKLAAQWANGLVRMANNYLRDQAIEEGERNIAYLTDQAPKVDVLGVKQAMFAILQDEINKVMMARGNVDYALKVVDPAFAPEMTAFPKRWVWLFVGMGSGFVIASIYVFLNQAARAGKVEKSPT